MKYASYFLTSIFVLFCFFGVGTDVTHAQFNTPLETSIGFQMNPPNPGANQFVIVSINSFNTDLNSAKITWKIDGKTVKSSTGLKNFNFYTKSAGKETTIDVVIETAEGEKITKTYSIKPASVDLIWEADGYIPPFYKGKTLFSHQDLIKFVAIPHIFDDNGQEIPASNLIYTWTKNGTVLGDFNGYGRSTYTMVGSIISRPLEIEVDVSSPDGVGTGSAFTRVAPNNPQILFYYKDPLTGVQFQKTLSGTVPMNNLKEMEIVSAPFYFGTSNPQNGSLRYTWMLNNSNIETGDQSKVFRRPGDSAGTSYVTLTVENALKELQEASASLALQFGD